MPRLKKKKKSNKEIIYLTLRYIILILIGIPGLWIFYYISTPLTIYPSYWLLNLFYNASLAGNTILIQGCPRIELIEACVAGSAYYLLLILNLTTKMKARIRFFSILFSFSFLLILNILRIFSLSILFIQNFQFFDITHKLFWYLISIFFVVGIWFLTTKLFKIKKIPVYSDIKSLINSRISN